MKTKNLIALLLIGVLSVTTISAQHQKPDKPNRPEGTHRPDPKKFKVMKIAYLTEKLELTPEEAQQFWPIYNEFESKKKLERKEFRDDKKDMEKEIELSDADIEKMLNEHLQLKQDELNLEKEYLAKFKTVLPMKKVGDMAGTVQIGDVGEDGIWRMVGQRSPMLYQCPECKEVKIY